MLKPDELANAVLEMLRKTSPQHRYALFDRACELFPSKVSKVDVKTALLELVRHGRVLERPGDVWSVAPGTPELAARVVSPLATVATPERGDQPSSVPTDALAWRLFEEQRMRVEQLLGGATPGSRQGEDAPVRATASAPTPSAAHSTSNKGLAEKVFGLQQEILRKRKGSGFGDTLGKAIESILSCPEDLASATEHHLLELKLPGVTARTGKLVHRLIRGEAIDEVVRGLPDPPPRSSPRGRKEASDQGEWSGSWDNAVKANESD